LAFKLEQLGTAQQLVDAYPLWYSLDASLRKLIAFLDETEHRRTT
jgi:hypothetical protein